MLYKSQWGIRFLPYCTTATHKKKCRYRKCSCSRPALCTTAFHHLHHPVEVHRIGFWFSSLNINFLCLGYTASMLRLHVLLQVKRRHQHTTLHATYPCPLSPPECCSFPRPLVFVRLFAQLPRDVSRITDHRRFLLHIGLDNILIPSYYSMDTKDCRSDSGFRKRIVPGNGPYIRIFGIHSDCGKWWGRWCQILGKWCGRGLFCTS